MTVSMCHLNLLTVPNLRLSPKFPVPGIKVVDRCLEWQLPSSAVRVDPPDMRNAMIGVVSRLFVDARDACSIGHGFQLSTSR